MKSKNVLVTGGAGFIGSHLVDALLAQGHRVRIFDSLTAQVHGGNRPEYLNPRAEFVQGDLCDYEAVQQALKDVEVIFHLASYVGVAQSNYEVSSYMENNVQGTANLIDSIIKLKQKPSKIITVSSMTSYGEGICTCPVCGKVKPALRTSESISIHGWEPVCPNCSSQLTPA